MTTYGEVADAARNTVMAVLFEGDIKGKTGWEKKSVVCHLYRAANHILLWLIGDRGEDHISHAQTRLAMAAWVMGRESRVESQKATVIDVHGEKITRVTEPAGYNFSEGGLDR